MRYLITGHTGFKGSWLTVLLTELGHTVSGIALDPEPVSLFNQAGLSGLLDHDIRADIRLDGAMSAALEKCQPDVLVHMAAQPLVRESYRHPRLTIETNVIGTLNVLEAASQCSSLRAQLIVTTDKVYRNVDRKDGYREAEPLGGDDPYSASKAMADLLTHAWVTSFPAPPTAVVRAGNVIGGGDYSKDRLMPDIVAALTEHRPVKLRNPSAVRPWQHVLDCLAGYLAIIGNLLDTEFSASQGEAWNIGPGPDSFRTVGEVADRMSGLWGEQGAYEWQEGEHPHEAEVLALDAGKARERLGWDNVLTFQEALAWTADWTLAQAAGASALDVTRQQISTHHRRAVSAST